jgi:predicted nucleotidyltransferase
MVDARAITDFVDEVVRRFRPIKVVLFGSYAYGTPTPDSDVDLLVIKQYRGSSLHRSGQIRQAVDANFAMDLLVHSPAEVRTRIASNDFFLQEVMDKGLVLHAHDDPRMGAQGRRRLRRRYATAQIPQGEPV